MLCFGLNDGGKVTSNFGGWDTKDVTEMIFRIALILMCFYKHRANWICSFSFWIAQSVKPLIEVTTRRELAVIWDL